MGKLKEVVKKSRYAVKRLKAEKGWQIEQATVRKMQNMPLAPMPEEGIPDLTTKNFDKPTKIASQEFKHVDKAISVHRNVIKAGQKGIATTPTSMAARMASTGRLAKKVAGRVAGKVAKRLPVIGGFLAAAGLASDAYAGYKAIKKAVKKKK